MELLLLLLLPSLALSSSFSGSSDDGDDPTGDPGAPSGPGNGGSGGGTGSSPTIGDLIEGTDGDDTLLGTPDDDTLLGGAGDDVLFGNDGDDTMRGAEGDDTLFGSNGDDLLRGGADADILVSQDGNDTLYGDHGEDVLFGRTLDLEESSSGVEGDYDLVIPMVADSTDDADELRGGRNDDMLLMGGNDTAYGGVGDDWFIAFDDNAAAATVADYDPSDDMLVLSYTGDTPPEITISEDDDGNAIVLADGSEAMTVIGMAGEISVSDVVLLDAENSAEFPTLMGSPEDDEFAAPGLTLSYDGGDGDDTVTGSAASETLIGGAGEDEIEGGHGGDVIDGGADNDVLDGGPGGDTIFGGTGDDTLSAGNSHSFDFLNGGAGNDVLTGNSFDVLDGGIGDDYLEIHGKNQSDESTPDAAPGVVYRDAELIGGEGNDTLVVDIDRLQDDSGEAFLATSTLTGGAGEDVFAVNLDLADNENVNLEGGAAALITDYTPGEDVIVLQSDVDLGAITVVPQENGDAIVMMGDREMIVVQGAAETLTVDDIQLSMLAA